LYKEASIESHAFLPMRTISVTSIGYLRRLPIGNADPFGSVWHSLAVLPTRWRPVGRAPHQPHPSVAYRRALAAPCHPPRAAKMFKSFFDDSFVSLLPYNSIRPAYTEQSVISEAGGFFFKIEQGEIVENPSRESLATCDCLWVRQTWLLNLELSPLERSFWTERVIRA
jgi:hypothetical protein